MTDKISDADLHKVMEAAREPVRKAYPERLKAWRTYFGAHCAGWTPVNEITAKAAFIAGWEARKCAQYKGDVS